MYSIHYTLYSTILNSRRINNYKKIQPAHSTITKRVLILSSSYFCENYSIIICILHTLPEKNQYRHHVNFLFPSISCKANYND